MDAEKAEIISIFHNLKTSDYGSPALRLVFKNEQELVDDSTHSKYYSYSLSVDNSEDYPKSLYELAPVVYLYKAPHFSPIRDLHVNINSSNDLKDLMFASAKELDTKSDLFFILMKDGVNKVSYISNLIYMNEKNKLSSPFPQVIVKAKTRSSIGIKYELSVINWRDIPEGNYKIDLLGDNGSDQQTQDDEPKKYGTMEDVSKEDLGSLSFDLNINLNPRYLFIEMTEDEKDPFISNLTSTEIKTFIPGDSFHTSLVLKKDLDHSYERNSVAIYANLAHATHGETKNEVLGSGDGSQALQEFPLRQFPLTYLPAPTPQGAESTLKVRVNDILWHESESFVDMGPSDRKFITKRDDNGKTKVIFGNGVKGLRLPTSVENIKAVYRTGIGKAGNVRAGRISLLMTRPLGVKGVINPIMAKGGVDPEGVYQARHNAPLAVMALDRLVSVRDYEDYARSYAGIGKASAVRLSDGRREVVHLSIAGIDDVPLDQESDLYKNLFQALRRYGDPHQPLRMDICERMLLFIKANVRLDPDYLWSSVEPKIRAALLEAFSFEVREPGQDVVSSEIISIIQQVPGVVYVDLDLLDSISEIEASDPAKEAKRIVSLLDNMAGSGRGDGARLEDRIPVDLATQYDKDGKLLDQIRPAQIAYLSPEIPEAIALKELI
jgi:hypothetical protein